MQETRIHPVTGKLLRRDVRRRTVAYRHLSEEVDVPGWYPDDDSDAVHSGTDLAGEEDVFQRLKRQAVAEDGKASR